MTRAHLALPLLLACGGKDGGADTAASDGAAEPDAACPVEPYNPVAGCLVTHALDFDADGRLLDYDHSWYNEDGDLISYDERNGEDYTDWIACTRTMAGPGRPASERCVGRSTYTYTWTYDGSGILTGRTYDTGSDGLLEKTWADAADAEGHITGEEIDSDADGITDSSVVYTYEGDLLTEEAWDYDHDGVVDYTRAWTYTDGLWTTEDTDKDGDGVVDATRTIDRDADGLPTELREDDDADGEANIVTTYSYVGCDLESTLTRDVDTAPVRDTYRYDAQGRKIGRTTDFGDNGDPDSTDAWTWACPGDEG